METDKLESRGVLVNPVQQHFKFQKELLKARYRVAKSFIAPSDIGTSREGFVEEFLKGHLPTKARIGRGEIVDSQSTRSGQVDLVVLRDEAPVLNVGTGDVFLCEGVYAAIEVKSSLDRSSLTMALDAIRKIKELRRASMPMLYAGKQPGQRVRCYVFAYEGTNCETTYRNLLEYFRNNSIDPKEYGPDAICVLDQPMLLKNDDYFFKREDKDTRPYIADATGRWDELMLFFAHLSKDIFSLNILSFDFSYYLEGEQRIVEEKP